MSGLALLLVSGLTGCSEEKKEIPKDNELVRTEHYVEITLPKRTPEEIYKLGNKIINRLKLRNRLTLKELETAVSRQYTEKIEGMLRGTKTVNYVDNEPFDVIGKEDKLEIKTQDYSTFDRSYRKGEFDSTPGDVPKGRDTFIDFYTGYFLDSPFDGKLDASKKRSLQNNHGNYFLVRNYGRVPSFEDLVRERPVDETLNEEEYFGALLDIKVKWKIDN